MEKYGIPSLLWLDGGTGYNLGQMAMEKMFLETAEAYAEAGEPFDDEQFIDGMGGMTRMSGREGSMENFYERYQRIMRSVDPAMEYGCYPPGMLFGATWDPAVIEECGHQLGREVNVRGIDVLLGTPNVNLHRDPRNGRLFEV